MSGNSSNEVQLNHHIPSPEKRSPLPDRERDPGITFSGKVSGILLLGLMLLFLLNLFLALFTILIGPALVFPELPGEEVTVLFGLTGLEGTEAAVYYLILTAIIVLSFYKALKEDGRELLKLIKKEVGWNSDDDLIGAPPKNVHYDGIGKRKPISPSLFSPYLNNAFVLVALFFFSVYAFEFFFGILITDILGITRHYPSSIFDVPL